MAIVRVIKYRRLRWLGHVARMDGGMNAFKILTGKPTGKRPLGRPFRRRGDIISGKMRTYNILPNLEKYSR